ncbi:MAG: formate dehydrogenase accessory sulfurtransferase FdhD, partial [Arenimonas sp.]
MIGQGADEPALALLALLTERDGVSLPVAARRLGLGQSELRRVLAALGDEPALRGPGLVAVREDGGRELLWLTATGRSFATQAPDAALPQVPALRIEGDARSDFTDTVIAEAPVALLYNGIAFAVMLATPSDLDDFALGFSLSEGIVTDASTWRLLERVDSAEGITLDMAIPQARADLLEGRRRGLAGRSGCGLCGVESLQAALPPVAAVPRGAAVPVAA